jgi:hypothetical protein
MQSQNPVLRKQAFDMLAKTREPVKLGKDEILATQGADGKYKTVLDNKGPGEIKDGFLVPDGKGGWMADPNLYALQKELKATGATRVSVSPTVKVGQEFGTDVAKFAANKLTAQVEAAQAAPAAIASADNVLNALQTGKVISGPGTKWRITAQQLFGNDQEKLDATRATIMGLARIQLDSRQSLKGQGALSDAEQRMLSNATSGNIDDLSTGEVELIMRGSRDMHMRNYQTGMKAADTLRKNPMFAGVENAFDLPPLPSATMGIESLVNKYATPGVRR